MIKFRLYLDKDAETKWLNEMAEQGWALEKFAAGFYSFEKCNPGQYIYQVDMGNKLFSVSEDYRDFMNDTGIEIVQTWGYWVILRKEASKGTFELYTDIDSSIEHYSKIRRMFKGVAVIEIICLFVEIFGAVSGVVYAYAFSFLIGALLLAIMSAIAKTNEKIAELRERKGETETEGAKRYISMVLPCGLLLNSIALIMKESVEEPIVYTIQIAAIAVMLAGVYKTAKKWR